MLPERCPDNFGITVRIRRNMQYTIHFKYKDYYGAFDFRKNANYVEDAVWIVFFYGGDKETIKSLYIIKEIYKY